MTAVKEILDRLSGIHPVREKLEALSARLERMADHLLDHEKRLVRLETRMEEREERGRKN